MRTGHVLDATQCPAWFQFSCSGFRTRLQALVPGFHMVSFKDRTAIYGFPFRRAFDLSGLSEAGKAPVGNVYRLYAGGRGT